MQDLTAFQRDLLYAIAAGDEPNGLAVKATLEEYYAEEVTPGRIYPNLESLVKQDLVEKEPVDDRANSYALTDQGVETIQARRQWEQSQLTTRITAINES